MAVDLSSWEPEVRQLLITCVHNQGSNMDETVESIMEIIYGAYGDGRFEGKYGSD